MIEDKIFVQMIINHQVAMSQCLLTETNFSMILVSSLFILIYTMFMKSLMEKVGDRSDIKNRLRFCNNIMASP